jgi:tRNA threonylcarbamoyladenosine biosynthesis protein TsaB
MKNLILALDCGLRWTNAAVLWNFGEFDEYGECDEFDEYAEDGEILASESLDIGRRQAAELPLIVERVLTEAGRGLDDVGLVAVTNGPGYFTGLRVGVSYAMALAYGLGVGVAPVSTLRMLACSRIEAGAPVLVLVYAGRERVYAASFGCKSGDLPPGEYALPALESWLSDRAGQRIALMSDDPQRAAQALQTSEICGLPILPSPPDASAVARIAWWAWRACQTQDRGAVIDPMALRISYLREPQIG